MKLIYWCANNVYEDDGVTSVVGDGSKVCLFTADYSSHHKYLIEGNFLKRYEISTEFYRIFPIKWWRLVP